MALHGISVSNYKAAVIYNHSYMCEDKSGDKTVIPAKTVSSVQGSDEKIKAVCCGCVYPLRKGVVLWIISIKRI